MKDYAFNVNFYDTYGKLYVEANNFEEAYDKATDIMTDALKDLPVQVDFDVECYDMDDEYEEE